MALLYVVIIYAVFTLFILTVCYYVNLISSKDQYTREEISNILPFVAETWQKVYSRYPSPMLFLMLLGSSFIGLLIPFLSSHWFFNSAVFFVVLYLVAPLAKERVDSVKVSNSDEIKDDLTNLFSRFTYIIVLGFGLGTATSLMYNWAQEKELSFLWFLLNLAAIVLLEVHMMNKELNE